ncbi:hypothetical protein TKK_0016986 [Trichogramma kaykai]|uniref:Mesoderm induction early response protein 1 n=1 Tax=Trichogramma kaykai TaxID=54128 RepID=A0ABD2W409_9HYME
MSRDESRRSKRARVDRDYEIGPTANIMANDYDDERTLDEEEALEAPEDTNNELDDLQKESDMPLNDLLSMYNYTNMSNMETNEDDEEDDEEDEDYEEEEDDDDPSPYEPDLKQFYTEMVKAENGSSIIKPDPKTDNTTDSNNDASTLNATIRTSENEVKTGDTNIPVVECTVGVENVNNIPNVDSTNSNVTASAGGTSRLLRSVSRPQSEEEDDDCDYSPDEEEWKKTIMVGTDYQAAIPEGLCRYDDALPYENEDKILWNPHHMNENDVQEFLEHAMVPSIKFSTLPNGIHIRDDEQALYLLLQCGYNLEEALRRRRMNAIPPNESVSLWSEEECHNFESGLRSYGKDFHLIQKNKVRTRSVGELVQFYYLWKKTERHDIYTYKARLEKKKYALHPGITDYMDRFLEEQEGVRDRSSSPNVHSMLHGDVKRQRTSTNSLSNDDPPGKSNVDNWDGATCTASTSTVVTSTTSGPLATTTTTTMATPTVSTMFANSDSPVNNSQVEMSFNKVEQQPQPYQAPCTVASTAVIPKEILTTSHQLPVPSHQLLVGVNSSSQPTDNSQHTTAVTAPVMTSHSRDKVLQLPP